MSEAGPGLYESLWSRIERDWQVIDVIAHRRGRVAHAEGEVISIAPLPDAQLAITEVPAEYGPEPSWHVLVIRAGGQQAVYKQTGADEAQYFPPDPTADWEIGSKDRLDEMAAVITEFRQAAQRRPELVVVGSMLPTYQSR